MQIAFIGGGNMASAIIGGLLRQGFAPGQIDVVEPWAEARERLQKDYGVVAQAEAGAFLAAADMVVWAVKPQTFKEAATQVRAHNTGALHLSVAAGIRSDSIAQWLGTERIIRTMPNTPALLGAGVTGLYASARVDTAGRDFADRLLSAAGKTVWLADEAQMDAVTAVSGSGPAYVFLLAEAMVDAGITEGLAADAARRLALQTVLGAARMLTESDVDAAELRRRVTSPNGTTQAAIEMLEAGGFRGLVKAAIHAARRRGQELSAAND